jgi:F-type H+-transporting ATPase subunit a
MEMIIESLYNLVKSTAGKNIKARAFFPIVSTFFIFIIMSNWIGLLPGVGSIGFLEQPEEEHMVVEEAIHQDLIQEDETGHEIVDEHQPTAIEEKIVQEEKHLESLIAEEKQIETQVEAGEAHDQAVEGEHSGPKFVPFFRGPTADLNTTLALAFCSIVLIQFTGFKFLGFNYSKKFINFAGPIDFFVGFLELFSELSKIISFAFRLFGNIFAGEVLLAVIGYLMPLIAPLPFLGLEIFVGFIQALVFSMLTLVFLNIATISHSAEDH